MSRLRGGGRLFRLRRLSRWRDSARGGACRRDSTMCAGGARVFAFSKMGSVCPGARRVRNHWGGKVAAGFLFGVNRFGSRARAPTIRRQVESDTSWRWKNQTTGGLLSPEFYWCWRRALALQESHGSGGKALGKISLIPGRDAEGNFGASNCCS